MNPMDKNFPPLLLNAPTFLKRRKEKGKFVPLPEKLIKNRATIAKRLRKQLTPLKRALHGLTPDQIKAIMVKVQHEKGIELSDFSGTGFKPITMPGDEVTLVVPRSSDLSPLEHKLDKFGTGKFKRGQPEHAKLGLITKIALAKPRDRLSSYLNENFARLTKGVLSNVVDGERKIMRRFP